MAERADALAALRAENDKLRARLGEVEALRAREVQTQANSLHLQKSLQLRSAFLLELTDRLRSEESAASIMAATAELLGHYLGASRVGYGLVQPDDETILFEGSYVNGVAPLTGSHALTSYDHVGIDAQRRGETFVASDTRVLETRDRWAAIYTGAFISVPRVSWPLE